MPHVTQIARENFNTIYLKGKKNRLVCARDVLLSYSFLLRRSAPLISSSFSRSKCRTIPTHSCATIERPVFASVDLFPFSSYFPPSLYSSSSSTAIARILFFHARHPSSSSSRFLASNAYADERAEAMYTVTHKYSDTVISEHFHIFLLSFAQVKVSDEIKLDLFLQAFFGFL